jgi:hypothetical protein
MLVSQLLSLPADVVVEELLLEKQVLTLVLASTQPTRCCPVCSQPSTSVHSRYGSIGYGPGEQQFHRLDTQQYA